MSSSTSAGQLSRKLATLLVQVPNLSSAAQARLASSFQTVHYATGGKGLTKEVLDETDWSFTTNKGLEGVEKFEETKELKVVQLCSSGADKAIASPSFSHQAASSPPAANPVTLCTASGIHVLSIPNYIVTTWLSLYHRLPAQILVARNDRRWGTREEFGGKEGYYAKGTRGKTVGFLGYGHLARDTARLMVSFGVEIIAANSDGQRKKDYGFVYPGTGDIDASLPSQMYSTSDPEQLKAFLERTDILVASLPSTPSTKGLLTRERLGYLPKEAVLINVGRGDLFQSDDLLHVLDKADGLWGAALDVTQPEPLPNDHPLWSHPKTIITPHLSGDTENEMDLAVDILLENVRRWRAGEDLANVVDLQKGY